jgi:hypothetical protein
MLKSSVSLRLKMQAVTTLHVREYCSQHGRRHFSNCRHGTNRAGRHRVSVAKHTVLPSFMSISSANRRESIHKSYRATWFKRLTFLTSILEVSGSKLGWDTGLSWLGFSSVPRGKCWDSTSNYTATVSFHIPSTVYSIIRRVRVFTNGFTK